MTRVMDSWHPGSQPLAEPERIAALGRLGILDTPPEPVYDELTALAAELCDTPMALVSLVDTDRQWFKSRIGVQVECTPRSVSFCAHALGRRDLLVVPDARDDPRFANNPIVTGEPWIRFYAGAPLTSPEGHTFGTLCVLDTRPRTLTDRQARHLEILGRQVTAHLHLRASAVRVAESRRALAASERRWRTLVEGSPVAVAVVDDHGRFAYVNAVACELYGATDRKELLGQVALERIGVDDEATARAQFRSVLAGHPLRRERWRLRRLDGAQLDVEVNAAPVAWAGQAAVQLQLRDTTAQVEVERARAEQAARWRALFVHSPVGIGLVDADERFAEVNAALCTVFGRERDELIGHRSAEFTHAEDRSTRAANAALLDASGDGVARSERRIVLPDGSIRWVWLSFSRTEDTGSGAWSVGHVHDVTDRKAYEQQLAESEAKLRAVAEVAQQVHSGRAAIPAIIAAAAQLCDASLVTLFEPDRRLSRLEVTFATDPSLVGTAVATNATSATTTVFDSGAARFLGAARLDPLVSPALLELAGIAAAYIVPVVSAGERRGVMIVGWDRPRDQLDDSDATVIALLADQAAAALRHGALLDRLEQVAATDALTGLANRRGWDTLVADAMAASLRSGAPLSVAIADLDHFKRYNDTYGHGAGDRLLEQVAGHLRARLRHGDQAARWGGEEFAVVLVDCDELSATRVLTRVLEGLPDGQTCSAGHATWDRRETAEELLDRADRALYRAKLAGRRRIVAA
jgi:diguanylate cyclase (GGDEF)-like protein/PAS domain S-box-containing protein